ncbi:MAG: hypothetical protein ACK511_08535, partial [Burkholderiales bacterium]|jgi:hypothetical protein
MQTNNLFAFLVLSIGRKFPRIFFVSIHEGLTGARGKSSPYLIAESIEVPFSEILLFTAISSQFYLKPEAPETINQANKQSIICVSQPLRAWMKLPLPPRCDSLFTRTLVDPR